MSRNLSDAIECALRGNADAMADIARADQPSIREAEASIGRPLIVTRDGAVRVLRGFVDGRYSTTAVQAWASFMRRGFVEGTADGPIRPIEIEFEEAWEDAISAAVSRLDEIGDVIDGEVTAGEALDLLQLLGEP